MSLDCWWKKRNWHFSLLYSILYTQTTFITTIIHRWIDNENIGYSFDESQVYVFSTCTVLNKGLSLTPQTVQNNKNILRDHSSDFETQVTESLFHIEPKQTRDNDPCDCLKPFNHHYHTNNNDYRVCPTAHCGLNTPSLFFISQLVVGALGQANEALPTTDLLSVNKYFILAVGGETKRSNGAWIRWKGYSLVNILF